MHRAEASACRTIHLYSFLSTLKRKEKDELCKKFSWKEQACWSRLKVSYNFQNFNHVCLQCQDKLL